MAPWGGRYCPRVQSVLKFQKHNPSETLGDVALLGAASLLFWNAENPIPATAQKQVFKTGLRGKP